MSSSVVTGNTVGILDFNIPALGASATEDDLAQYQKAAVTIGTCKKCHGDKMEGAAHANGYLDTRACVICHSPFYGSSRHAVGFMYDDKAVLDQMVHEIHAAIASPGLGEERGWNTITFPQNVKNCVICHADPQGLDTGANATLLDNWKKAPSIEACTSCHTTTTFSGADITHQGGAQTDGSCTGCHTATGAPANPMDIVTAHAVTATASETPEFDVVMSTDTPAAGYYVSGDTPVITVKLKYHDGAHAGELVPGTVYTTPSTDATSAVGQAGGGLSNATLYVYGPRNMAAPVLTLNASADRGESLLLPFTDTNLTVDADGYHYKLQPIPEDMAEGTYIAGTQMTDYGFISATDWKTTSSAAITFQIGTTDVTPKASGDACLGCHGDTRMHNNNDGHPHNVPFDTDYCNMCHDTTGLHGNPIANRVHAVHSATSNGDLGAHASYDWSDVTFPQNVQDCTSCHNSGGKGYLNDYMIGRLFWMPHRHEQRKLGPYAADGRG